MSEGLLSRVMAKARHATSGSEGWVDPGCCTDPMGSVWGNTSRQDTFDAASSSAAAPSSPSSSIAARHICWRHAHASTSLLLLLLELFNVGS